MLRDRGPVTKKLGDTKLAQFFSKDAVGNKFLQQGSETTQALKSAGVSAVSNLIRPEELLRTDKKGLRTKYGAQDVAGRALQGLKGVGLMALGDPVGGVMEIGSSIIGLASDKKQVERDRRTEFRGKRDKALKEYMSNLIGSSVSEAEKEMQSKMGAMRGYNMIGKKGMITPEKNMDTSMSSFLSDGYKMYLSKNNKMNDEMAGGGHLRTHSPGSAAHSRPLDLRTQKEYKNGGMVKGPSHKRGGVKFNVGGEVVELEGGEAVINKKSTKMFRDVLSQINQAGGGVRFEKGGMLKY